MGWVRKCCHFCEVGELRVKSYSSQEIHFKTTVINQLGLWVCWALRLKTYGRLCQDPGILRFGVETRRAQRGAVLNVPDRVHLCVPSAPSVLEKPASERKICSFKMMFHERSISGVFSCGLRLTVAAPWGVCVPLGSSRQRYSAFWEQSACSSGQMLITWFLQILREDTPPLAYQGKRHYKMEKYYF